jgi:hypothetical protein
MAAQWGSNTLGPGNNAFWFFARSATNNFLPILSVRPLSPSFTDAVWLPGGYNQLGASAIWSRLSEDGSVINYYMIVSNWSYSTIQYAFLEADL